MKKYLLVTFTAALVLCARAQSTSIFAGGNGSGTNLNQLDYPVSVYLDAQGNLYECELYNSRIMKFPANSDSQTNGVIVAGGNGSGHNHNQLNLPTGVFVDASNNVFVVDEYNNRILKFPAGSNSTTNGIIVAAKNLDLPSAVVVTTSGDIYVADQSHNRILKFPSNSDSTTAGVIIAGGNGVGAGFNQFNVPCGLFLDATGNMYVCDQYNSRVLKFPANSSSGTNGVVVAGGNGAGSAANQLYNPTGVFLDAGGNLYVADYYNARIQKFPPNSTSATNGVTVAGGNGSGNAANQFNHPAGVYVDQLENLFIADQFNNRIVKYASGINSVDEVAGNATLLLYPNPNNGSFTLQSTGCIGNEYSIYEMQGRLVKHGLITNNRQTVILNDMAPGTYLLKIKGENASVIRFVVE